MNSAAPLTTAPDSKRWLTYAVTALLAFAGVELFFSRQHFLDDAFIYLRIAHRLIDVHRFEYNDGTAGFVTSSPLYTSALAAFSLFSRTTMSPKILNLTVYLALLALIVRRLPTCVNQTKSALWLAGLLVVVSPMCVRWLTDGMETGLVALAAVVLAIITNQLASHQRGIVVTAGAIAAGAVAVVLRVEFGFVLATAIAALGIHSIAESGGLQNLPISWSALARKTAPFVLGGLIGAGFIMALRSFAA